MSRVTLDRVRAAARTIAPVFLHSPQFGNEGLDRALGQRVLLKVETLNPIRSFKGRGGDWYVAQQPRGTTILCASAGNFGQAIAWAARERGCTAIVYASVNATPVKLDAMRAFGAEVRLFGADFDAAKEEAARVAVAGGLRFVEDGADLETLEGAGTIALELHEAGAPEVLLVPLGNGALINGIGQTLRALGAATRVVAVQAAGAPAMVESFRSGHLVRHETIDTICDGIGVRVPIPVALADMRLAVDDALLVSEGAVREGMRLLAAHTGLMVEPSAAAGIAALLEHGAAFAGARVGTILCGSNLTDAQRREWML
jgi:threonine dehydratase